MTSIKNRLSDIYEKLVLDRPVIALLLVLFVVGYFAYHIKDFKLDASADSLLLENDKDLRYFRRIIERYGTNDYLVVTYNPKEVDLFSDTSLSNLKQLRDELSQLNGIDSVITILDVPLLFTVDLTLGELANKEKLDTLEDQNVDKAMAKKEFLNNPLYRKRILSSDGTTTAVLMALTVDETARDLLKQREILREKKFNNSLTPEETEKLQEVSERYRIYSTKVMQRQNALVENIRKILERYRDNAVLYLGGVPMIVHDMIDFIRNDIVVFGIGVFIFLIVTMSIIFRKKRWVLLPLLCCSLSVITMMGYLGLMDWRVTVISSNFISLMLIFTMSLTIHIIVRYRELHALSPEADQRTLVLQTVRMVFLPCFYTVLTTISAFVSLLVSDIRPVMDFGLMMTTGLAVAFILSFVVFPAGLMILKKGKPQDKENSHPPFTLNFARLTEGHGRKVVLISILLAIISGIGISRLKVENRFIDYFREDTEIHQGMKVIDQKLGGTTPLDIIINFEEEEVSEFEEDPFEDPFKDSEDTAWYTSAYKMGQIEKVHDYLYKLPQTGEVLSIATLIKIAAKLNDNKELDNFELALLYKKSPEKIKEMLIYPYISKNDPQARLTTRVMETDKTLNREYLLKKIHNFLVNRMGFNKDQVRFTNVFVLYNNMLQSLFRSQILTIGAVFLAIMIMFMVLFRSFYIAFVAIIPNLLPAAMVLGSMGLLGIPLDIMTITIASISIGIAVDDTIHYIHRFKKEFAKDRNYLAAMYRCHGSIGRAMYYTSITIIIGFSILVMSNFIPTIYFGMFTGFAMLAAMLAALTLLPQLIIWFKPMGPEKS